MTLGPSPLSTWSRIKPIKNFAFFTHITIHSLAEVKPAIQSLVVGFTVQLQSSGKWSNLEQIKHKIQKYFKSKDFLTHKYFLEFS